MIKLIFDGPKYRLPLIEGIEIKSFSIFFNEPEKLFHVAFSLIIFSTIDLGAYYAILPSDGRLQQRYQAAGVDYTQVPQDFAYNSGSNPQFLSVEQLRSLILENVDPGFKPL